MSATPGDNNLLTQYLLRLGPQQQTPTAAYGRAQRAPPVGVWGLATSERHGYVYTHALLAGIIPSSELKRLFREKNNIRCSDFCL
jgi:hypothetical protein